MHIVPPARSGLHGALRGVGPVASGQIKLATGKLVNHPGDLAKASRVSAPRRVRQGKPGATIAARDSAGGDAHMTRLVTLGRSLGLLTYLPLLPVKATSLDNAMLEFPHLRDMVAAAKDMAQRQRASHEAAPQMVAGAPMPTGASMFLVHARITRDRIRAG